MATKLLNIFIAFTFLFSIIFFCVDTQINYNNSLPNSKIEESAGSGETSGTIKN